MADDFCVLNRMRPTPRESDVLGDESLYQNTHNYQRNTILLGLLVIGRGYFKGLRTEKLAKNISVTLFCPGPVFSNFLSRCFTSKKGEEFGQDVAPTDRRMTTSRCAYLCAVAIANKLDEAWVGMFPVVPITYLLVFFPTLSKWIAHFIGTKEMMKLRDSKVVIKTND